MELTRDKLFEIDLEKTKKYMKMKLYEHRNKDTWEKETIGRLFELLKQEVNELEVEVKIDKNNHEEILKESADVANFAMMIIGNITRRNKWII